MGSGGGTLPQNAGCSRMPWSLDLGEKGGSCMVCDLSPLVRVLASMGWRGMAEYRGVDRMASSHFLLLGLFSRRAIQGGVQFLLHHLLTGWPSPDSLARAIMGMTDCRCWPRLWSSTRRLALLKFMWLWEPVVDRAVSCLADSCHRLPCPCAWLYSMQGERREKESDYPSSGSDLVLLGTAGRR